MPKSKRISVHDFQGRIWEEMERIASEQGWDINNQAGRGYSFQLWAAETIAAYEDRFDTSPEDALQKSQDLGADLVFEDSSGGHLLICQCKFASMAKKAATKESEVTDFFGRHNLYMDRDWVLDHASERAAALLSDYSEKIEAGYSVTYRFITTSYASDRVKEAAAIVNNQLTDRGLSIACELIDFPALKDYYIRAASLELTIPGEVRFPVKHGKSFYSPSPYPTLIASVSGNTLRDLYNKYKESLLAYNIRGYLGGVGINKAIRETAEKEADRFFYFNNGVSAVCTEFTVEDDMVVAKDFQVINGAQTIGSLRLASPQPNLEVLFRLTKTEDVKTIKGFNRDIIKFQNTQNVIKISDFRSNDPIQVWLEEEITATKVKGRPLPKLRYLRRRAVGGGRSLGTGIRLEDLAKIRYAFFYEPTAISSAPKSLWTHEEDGELYEKSFGVDGKLLDSWSRSDFEWTLVAIAFYLRIVRRATEAGKASPNVKYLKRLRFHLLALAGEYVRRRYSEAEALNLVRSEASFEEAWEAFFDSAFDAVDSGYEKVNDGDLTMFAFVRNTIEWDRMRSRFSRKLSISSS